MSKPYVASDANLTLGTGNVLLALRTATGVSAGAHIAIRRIEIGQTGTTTAEMCRGEIATRDTAGTLTCTSITPRAISPLGGPASGLSGNTAPVGGAGRIGTDSSADSGGTYTTIYPFTFHNLNGWLWVPTPEERIEVPPDTAMVIRFTTAPTGTSGWHIAFTYEELT